MKTPDNIQLFQFQNSDYLYLLLTIPVIVGIFVFVQYLKGKALDRLGDRNLIEKLMPEASLFRNWLKFSILILVLASLVFAIARPQYGSKTEESERESAEIVIALDVSNSMLAEDIKPNRLERAKQAIVRLLQKTKDDKIGLVVFGGEAYTQIPLTSDYSGAELYLEAVNTNAIPVQGTNLKAAINHAINSFNPETETGKVLILISDGENHEEEAIEAAQVAYEQGITVSTIGMGLPHAVTIPDQKNGGYKKDAAGNNVLTKLNEDVLMKIAEAGHGIYTSGNNIESGLSKIADQLSETTKSKVKMEVAEYDDYYIYLVWFALLLVCVEFFILERKNRWLRNLKIFE